MIKFFNYHHLTGNFYISSANELLRILIKNGDMDHNFHFENARDSPSQMNFVNGFSVKSFITLLHGREIGSGMPPAIYILPIFMEIHMVILRKCNTCPFT